MQRYDNRFSVKSLKVLSPLHYISIDLAFNVMSSSTYVTRKLINHEIGKSLNVHIEAKYFK